MALGYDAIVSNTISLLGNRGIEFNLEDGLPKWFMERELCEVVSDHVGIEEAAEIERLLTIADLREV